MPPSMNPLKRARTPATVNDHSPSSAIMSTHGEAKDHGMGDDRRRSLMRDLQARSERMIAKMFGGHPDQPVASSPSASDRVKDPAIPNVAVETLKSTPNQARRPARTIDEDYGDEEDDDDDDAVPPETTSPLQARAIATPTSSQSRKPPLPLFSLKPPLGRRSTASSAENTKTSEEVRKKLQEEKKAAEEAAKESFLTTFYTLENDRDAMLEQQRLDELDRQVENEMSGGGPGADGQAQAGSGPAQQGTLSSANLGASSLTLKHLIARIDSVRAQVRASDGQLRSLMSEVRKNRSKWASEDKVGQEELYEAAERVLMELKSMTEYAAPFLQRVNKRDAPDYYRVITNPMDIGTMIKKLKQLEYKSKKEFVDHLNLIWTNCLEYNRAEGHPLRKKAEHMRKETARLVPLIPDITVRDRAEVEREERQAQLADAEGSESDDDDKPIAATRGRKAPSKGVKGAAGQARKAPPAPNESSPAPDARANSAAPGHLAGTRADHLRNDADSTTEVGSQHGLTTPPPPGFATPSGPNGVVESNADISEIEVTGIGMGPGEDPTEEDPDYKTWKQITKKDRARAAADRHRLFKQDRLNPEEPALLRSKRGMRRWMRQQKTVVGEDQLGHADELAKEEAAGSGQPTTLAEDMGADVENTLPDYYDPISGVPAIPERLRWVNDNEGVAIDPKEEYLRVIPKGTYQAPKSTLATRIEANLRQIQDTRKVVSKIGIVRQMQLQTQTYANQFQKYEPQPFVDEDPGAGVVSDDGPLMTPALTRATLQRSIGKIFYHAGFEEFQPSALEAMTDLAGEYFTKLVRTLGVYCEAPLVEDIAPVAAQDKAPATIPVESDVGSPRYRPRFTQEEQILHTLHENGMDLDGLEEYITQDVARFHSKLQVHHERMRDHYAELLRPALDPALVATDGGASAFDDGNENQFVAGDFAEDIDEDFFGFKELGLDREFGLASLSVPLHLLQSRMNNAYQPTSQTITSSVGQTMENPSQYPALSADIIDHQIGLVCDFFRERLEKHAENGVLIEDDDLPAKQRFPKPRLPPTGKISSPRKRPLREQQMLARKKRRMEIDAEREREREANGLANGTTNDTTNKANGIAQSNGNNVSATTDSLPNGTSKTTSATTNKTPSTSQDVTKPTGKAKLEAPSATPTHSDPQKPQTNGDGADGDADGDAEGEPDDLDEQDQDGTAENDEDRRKNMLNENMPIAAH